MSKMELSHTTMNVSLRNRDWLKSIGKKGETYDDVLDRVRTKLQELGWK